MHLGEGVSFGGSRCLQLMTSHACTRETTAVFDICALPRYGKPPTATAVLAKFPAWQGFRFCFIIFSFCFFFLLLLFLLRIRGKFEQDGYGKRKKGDLLRLPCGFRVRLLDTVFRLLKRKKVGPHARHKILINPLNATNVWWLRAE